MKKLYLILPLFCLSLSACSTIDSEEAGKYLEKASQKEINSYVFQLETVTKYKDGGISTTKNIFKIDKDGNRYYKTENEYDDLTIHNVHEYYTVKNDTYGEVTYQYGKSTQNGGFESTKVLTLYNADGKVNKEYTSSSNNPERIYSGISSSSQVFLKRKIGSYESILEKQPSVHYDGEVEYVKSGIGNLTIKCKYKQETIINNETLVTDCSLVVKYSNYFISSYEINKDNDYESDTQKGTFKSINGSFKIKLPSNWEQFLTE